MRGKNIPISSNSSFIMRIMADGSLSGGINWEGVHHYNKLIDELVSNGLYTISTITVHDIHCTIIMYIPSYCMFL